MRKVPHPGDGGTEDRFDGGSRSVVGSLAGQVRTTTTK